MLESAIPGCRVDVVDNGQKMVDYLERAFELDDGLGDGSDKAPVQPVVVFLDCFMPVMDGFSAAAAWREIEAGSLTKYLFFFFYFSFFL